MYMKTPHRYQNTIIIFYMVKILLLNGLFNHITLIFSGFNKRIYQIKRVLIIKGIIFLQCLLLYN